MNSSLSIVEIVRNADPVVQAIVAALVLCSAGCWAIILEKLVRLAGLSRQMKTLERFAMQKEGKKTKRSGIADLILAAARGETADLAQSRVAPYEARQRIEEAMRAATTAELRRLEGGLTYLATIGSAAPFIGLFGTVWGIMASFTSIAQSQNTSLEVVAPGIAEALLATATGLAAAIPAVIAYNQIATALGRAAQAVEAEAPRIAKIFLRERPGDER